MPGLILRLSGGPVEVLGEWGPCETGWAETTAPDRWSAPWEAVE